MATQRQKAHAAHDQEPYTPPQPTLVPCSQGCGGLVMLSERGPLTPVFGQAHDCAVDCVQYASRWNWWTGSQWRAHAR